MRIILENRKGNRHAFKEVERADKRALKDARRAKQNRQRYQGAIA